MSAPEAAVELRPVHWSDMAELAGHERDLFADDAWSEATWWAELAERPRRDYVVATDAEGILGYAGLDHGGDVADVMTIAVARRGRGSGLGRRLLAELEGRARAEHAAYLMLEVRADNAPARRLYDAAGFEVLTVRRRYYQPGDVDALVLRKSLGERGSDHGEQHG